MRHCKLMWQSEGQQKLNIKYARIYLVHEAYFIKRLLNINCLNVHHVKAHTYLKKGFYFLTPGYQDAAGSALST